MISQYIKYNLADTNETVKVKKLSKARKSSAKNRNWFNLKSMENESLSSVNCDRVNTWEPYHNGEIYLSSNNTYIENDMTGEPGKLKEKVYTKVDSNNQKLIYLK